MYFFTDLCKDFMFFGSYIQSPIEQERFIPDAEPAQTAKSHDSFQAIGFFREKPSPEGAPATAWDAVL